MKAITLKLPDTLDDRLTHFAREQRAESKSAVVRQAIEFYLSSTSKATPPSGAVVAKKWIGVVDLPPDTSANPAYLDDFGQ